MEELELFTQRAYLEVAAIQKDSEIVESPGLAYVKCSSIKERWSNAVVRASMAASDFRALDALINIFDAEAINFNWHLWESSSHPALADYLLKNKGLAKVGNGVAFFRLMDEHVPHPQQDIDTGLFKLDSTFLNSYIDAKMQAWKINPKWTELLREVSSAQLADPNRVIYVAIRNNEVFAGAGAYVNGDKAYLRGSFCKLEFRGLGYYRKLVQYREADLYSRGVRTLTTLADGETSAPILEQIGYEPFARFQILARHPSEWVSL